MNREDDLTAALNGGAKMLLGTLAAAGNDVITTAKSQVVFADVANTDDLLYSMLEHPKTSLTEVEKAAVIAALPYGSGYNVFTWLEKPANQTLVQKMLGHEWTNGDTQDYIISHVAQLGTETRLFTPQNDGAETVYYRVDVEGNVWNLDGTAANISLSNLTRRQKGDDTITGNDNDETFFGQEGIDTIHAGGGDDKLYGGTGDDMLYGEAGNDELYGGAGNDFLDGGSGTDKVYGGIGNDFIVYDASDVAAAGAGKIDGGAGIDFLLEKGSADIIGLNGDNSLDSLFSNSKIENVEVVLRGASVDDLVSIAALKEYGITLEDTDSNGNANRMALDSTWSEVKSGETVIGYQHKSGSSESPDLIMDVSSTLVQDTAGDGELAAFILSTQNGG
ncbi:MAG: hypothetical protein J6I40_03575 [Mailhella sp.]|nr:hypothetical protein [Mailhella sp.]